MTDWRADVNGSHVDSVVLALKWNLELQLIFIVLRSVGGLRDELSDLVLDAGHRIGLHINLLFGFILILILLLIFVLF